MRDIENRMVAEPERKWNKPAEVAKKLNGAGYYNLVTGIFVPGEDAFDYALEQCFEIVPEDIRRFKWMQEFKEMLVNWFYSGNWVHEDGRKAHIQQPCGMA